MGKLKTRVWIVGGSAAIVVALVLYSNSLDLHFADTARPMDRAGKLVPLPKSDAPSQIVDSNPKSPIRFTSMTEQSGIEMVYYGSPSPEHYMTEQNGGGVALFDYDGDDLLDIFLVNGSHFKKPAEQVEASNRIYRSNGDFRYDDVTSPAGLRASGFGMGCAAADYNNDGFTDLFVSYYGGNQLWQNNGDGTFDETTQTAGFEEDEWSCGGAFADFDGDGNLDLYVVNYVEWNEHDPPCYTQHQPPIRISCNPMTRRAQADRLFRSLGDGRFLDVGKKAGIALAEDGKGLAVAVADLDGDHRLDIYVANDTTRNFLFRNLGEMHFEEVGIIEGVGISEEGVAGASMGIACGDYNRDGRFDLFVTNFYDQANDAFTNLGDSGFIASCRRLGMDRLSRPTLAFGIVLVDFDLDSFPDLFVANGHIWDFTSLGRLYRYEMLPHLLQNRGGKVFQEVNTTAGAYFQSRWLGRAVAFGDLDNDGDADLVVTHLKQPPAILRNDSDPAGSSLRLRLVGTESARDPLGARVEVLVDDQRIVTHVPSGGSFQASHDSRVLIATAKAQSVTEVRVCWPGGKIESWYNLPVGVWQHLVQGTGKRYFSGAKGR